MTIHEVRRKITNSILRISDNASTVWHKNELMICGRLKSELETDFPDYDVDVEIIKDNKRRPDIVIHKLNVHTHNLATIQVKRNPTKEQVIEDIKKLEETLFRDPYNYQYGVFISIGALPEGLPAFDPNKFALIPVSGWKIEY